MEQKEALRIVINGLDAKTEETLAGSDNIMLFDPTTGLPNGKVSKFSLQRSLGDVFYGQCSTDAATAAKTVTISDFLLVRNGMVAIHFTKAVSVANVTLNINGTGAKPMYYHGAALTESVVKANTVVTMVYDGTRFNIISIEGLQQSEAPSDLWVDMGLPSGTKWARRNIDVTQPDGFAASEYQYECSFFSWGNTDGHNPTSTSSFGSYTFGTANNMEPYVSSPGAKLTASLSPSYDAARVHCGAPWRMSNGDDYIELFANCDFVNADGNVIDSATTNKLVTVNGITGIRIKSRINGNILFFPCSGLGYGSTWYYRGSNGGYWASLLVSASSGRAMGFASVGVYPQNYSPRFYGFAVRAVQ